MCAEGGGIDGDYWLQTHWNDIKLPIKAQTEPVVCLRFHTLDPFASSFSAGPVSVSSLQYILG